MATRPFEIVVPKHTGDRPPALLVWIPAADCGDVPAGWRGVLADHGIVWCGLNGAGNQVQAVVRIERAAAAVLEAPLVVPERPRRVFVGGFSGGARAASVAAMTRPQVFSSGALLVGGAGYYRDVPVPADGQTLPRVFDELDLPGCPPIRGWSRQRYALVVGTEDEWCNPMRALLSAMSKDGFPHVTQVEVTGMAHRLPPDEALDTALRFLTGKTTAEVIR